MQQEKVIEVRGVHAPSGRKLIAVDGPCGQKSIYERDEAVWTALLMLAVVSTAYPTAEEFARVIDRARSGISVQPQGGPLHYQPSFDPPAARRPA